MAERPSCGDRPLTDRGGSGMSEDGSGLRQGRGDSAPLAQDVPFGEVFLLCREKMQKILAKGEQVL